VRARYMTYELQLAMHRSSIDGTQRSVDPALLSWELINEPRLEGQTNSSLVAGWTQDVGQNLSSLDTHHLVSIGTEGFTSGFTGAYYNESHGASLNSLCSLDVITLCSAHLYPKYLGTSTSNTDLNTAIKRWRSIADALNKPIMLGEVGYDLNTPNSSSISRTQFYRSVAQSVSANALDGAMLWNFGGKHDGSFTLDASDENDLAAMKAFASSK
jgi:mannan endo-1,4-beta-mannosidase